MVNNSNHNSNAARTSLGSTHKTEAGSLQDNLQDLKQVHPVNTTDQDHARPDLNPPERTTDRVPDMNEGEDNLAASSAGTVGGAALGAALGIAGGPPGAIVGAAIGGVVGGIAGNDIAQKDQDKDDDYWHARYQHTDYYRETSQIHHDLDYERDYRAAYRLGTQQALQYDSSISFDGIEQDLQTQWQKVKGDSRLNWQDVKFAVKDAWQHVRA